MQPVSPSRYTGSQIPNINPGGTLTDHFCKAQPPEDLNLLEQRLTTAFHTAADKTIPLTKAAKQHYKDWWYYDKNVKEYKHKVNQAKKLHQRHNNDTTLALLRAAARTARKGTKAIKNTKWFDGAPTWIHKPTSAAYGARYGASYRWPETCTPSQPPRTSH